ncbi:HPP family protein [Paenibacillus sp. FJAT-27812]|uniref:HPP family protein n=1 Tax=Paenibacillus sp. FJAT-27812 TaxID=1684143 RepID=UPI0006A75E7A|nr:HPP family protein [Paenibacillus sp. FJAT-27812]
MRIRTYAICLYIILIYWISLHIPNMHALFFPTLGSFSLLFISRPFEKAEIRKIAFGAVIASIIGSVFVYFNSGAWSLFLTLLIVIYLINRFKWNSPPILAVSLIPFFAQSSVLWIIPLSVFGALLGLMITLSASAYVEKRCSVLPFFAKRSVKAESDTAM